MPDLPKKILVVEDERAISRALELKLAHEGFEVVLAFDGQGAIDALKKQQFDLVLLDLILPEIDGFSVLEKMKAGGIKTPVVVLSNLSQSEDLVRAKGLGAVDYFVKSNVPISEVVVKVKKLLNLPV